VSASKRLRVRDEPGIGAFVVELRPDLAAPSPPRMLAPDELDRLRAARRIVAERADAILEVALAMPAPVMRASPI
jgi:hypothetical protein